MYTSMPRVDIFGRGGVRGSASGFAAIGVEILDRLMGFWIYYTTTCKVADCGGFGMAV